MAAPSSPADSTGTLPAAPRPGLRRGWRRLLRAAFAAGLVAVAAVSLLPGLLLPGGGPSDKLMHALCYGVLAVNGALAVCRSAAAWLGLVAALFAFGVVLEAGQGLLPGRDASLADALANGAGILAGLALTALLTAAQAAVARVRPRPPGRPRPGVAGVRSSSDRAGRGRPVRR